MVYIAYYTELDLESYNYAQKKRRNCCENSKCAPDKNLVSIFAFAQRLPTAATLDNHVPDVHVFPSIESDRGMNV